MKVNSSSHQPNQTKHKQPSEQHKSSTRESRKKKKEDDAQMQKLSFNLQQTEKALKAFQDSFKNLQSTDRNLNTAESSQTSIPTAANNFLQVPKHSNLNIHTKKESSNMETTDEDYQIKEMQLQCRKINESSIEKEQTFDSQILSSCNDHSEYDCSSEHSFQQRGTPSVCSEQEVSKRETTQKSFDYKKYLQVEKENVDTNSSQREATCSTEEIFLMREKLELQRIPSASKVSESFKHYLDNMNSHSSTAIAGAMKALQKKIKSLESENTILKDCFQGIQKKCVDMEKSYQQEILKNQQMMIQQQTQIRQEEFNSTKSTAINVELEALQKQICELMKRQSKIDESKNKYKHKIAQQQQQIKDMKQQAKQKEEEFNNKHQEYQTERKTLLAQMQTLEQQNKEQAEAKKQSEDELAKYKNDNKSVEDKYKGKLHKYKKHIQQLRTELKMLEQSHQVSQKALKHTEHFVDEVVYVNDQLVHSLAKNKMKLRSVSGSQTRRSRRDINNSVEGGYFQDTLNSRDTRRRGSVQSHSVAMTPNYQNKHFKTFQTSVGQDYEPINKTEEPRKHSIREVLAGNQATAQKPPKSNRRNQFSFSKRECQMKSLQLQNLKNQQIPPMIHDLQGVQMLETSRFQDGDSLLDNSSLERINGQRSQYQTQQFSSNQSSKKILIDEDFTLQPYERQIDNVSQKIKRIQQDLESMGIECQSQRSNDHVLEQKQRELLSLKKEHDRLVKDIRERSNGRK